MSIKFLIVNTDYPVFLHWLYAQHPGLEHQSYEEQMQVRIDSMFGVADFYSSNLRKLGHEAWDIHANNEFMQKAWAKDNGVNIEERSKLSQRYRSILHRGTTIAAKTPLRYLGPLVWPVLRSLDSQQSWFYDILASQIRYNKPDVLLNQSMNGISNLFFKEMKPYVRLLVGQHAASKLPNSVDYGCYDLIISSFPPTIDWFRKKGITAELNRLAFEPLVLSHLSNKQRDIGVSFIGSLFHGIHNSRITLLEQICNKVDAHIWSSNTPDLNNPALCRSHKGTAWGMEMYQILNRSKITLNHHGDIAPYANNLRLFEATGVGTLLITDWKQNLHEMFEPGNEVVTYRSPEECAEIIRYYMEHNEERQAIARAGQERTLKEHTYYHRMQELVKIVNKYFKTNVKGFCL